MRNRSVAPSITETAFGCPHCGAYTTQHWYDLHAEHRPRDDRAPGITNPSIIDDILSNEDMPDEEKPGIIEYFQRKLRGLVLLDRVERGTYCQYAVANCNLSECYNCHEVSVWVDRHLVFPSPFEGPDPNPDIPDEVLLDYQEAGRILAVSPRGSAALLRLAIQKLCIALGEKGSNLDSDIASLVKKGLSPLVQQALDAVRVIGNEAVHPGTFNLRDDVSTAMQLFESVNVIAEQMISNPKHVAELYEKIPESKKEAIRRRDEDERTS